MGSKADRIIANRERTWEYHYSGSALSDTEIKAAPGEKKFIRITDIIARADGADSLVFKDGDGTQVLGKIFVNTTPTVLSLRAARTLAENKKLTVSQVGSATVDLTVCGYIEA